MTTLLERDQLFVRQKGKLIEVKTEFRILDASGADVGFIAQEGQGLLRKLVRFFFKIDQFFTIHLSVREANGSTVCSMTRPAKIFKSKVLVRDAAGDLAGRIVQRNMFGKIKFDFENTTGARIGGIKAENWRAWNFSIVNAADQEVARITKKWAGLLKASFTNADHYIYEVTGAMDPALRLFGLASAASVDLALKQDA